MSNALALPQPLALAALPEATQAESAQTPVMGSPHAKALGDFDFDIGRTYTVLTATLVLPLLLALSTVSYSLGVLY